MALCAKLSFFTIFFVYLPPWCTFVIKINVPSIAIDKFIKKNYVLFKGAAVAEWLSSWLAEQEVRGWIPGLATWIFRDWLSPTSKSRYGWKIAKSTFILKTTNQPMFCSIVLEPPITPVPPPRGNFRGYDFLKAYEKCYKMSHVCTLAVGAFMIFGVKREKLCKKSLKIGNNF